MSNFDGSVKKSGSIRWLATTRNSNEKEESLSEWGESLQGVILLHRNAWRSLARG
jgi:hypothetical protein